MAVSDDFEPWDWDDAGWEMNFVAQMQARREAMGWSQTELAKRLAQEGLRWHQPTVQRIESGQRPLKLTEALKVAEVLGTRLEVMLRAASVPMVYDELAEYLKASAFDHEVRDAERLQDDIEGNLNVLNEIVESYKEAVQQSPNFEIEPKLMAVADEFRRLNEELIGDARTVVLTLRAASNKFGEIPRDYPMTLRERDAT